MLKIKYPAAGKYVLAVSGGVDSMALLHLLTKAAGASNYQLVVAHFDHGIRTDSAEDAQLIKTALPKGLIFVTKKGRLGSGASEAIAREARYDFLRTVMKQRQARAIITAHHLDDKIETALLNLQRGTGRRGLSPFRSSPDILRPLEDVSKNQILAYVKKHKLTWREDSTNTDLRYARNRMRKLLSSLTPDERMRLIALIKQAEEYNQTMNKQVAKLLNHLATVSSRTIELDRQQLVGLSQPLTQEVLHTVVNKLRPASDISAQNIQQLVHFAKTAKAGKVFPLGKQLRATASHDSLTIALS
jgi:tRNA(Ile)-lysidine synthetase-like protein